jgi:hypothetical protein
MINPELVHASQPPRRENPIPLIMQSLPEYNQRALKAPRDNPPSAAELLPPSNDDDLGLGGDMFA